MLSKSNITNICTTNWESSSIMETTQMHYTQEGSRRSWDILKLPDSFEVCLYNVDRKKLLFLRQFRPGVYYSKLDGNDKILNKNNDLQKYPPKIGFTTEFLSGFIKEDKNTKQLVKEKIATKIGYDVPADKIEKVRSFLLNAGPFGNKTTLYYSEVTDKMKLKQDKTTDEFEIIEMSIEDVKNCISAKINEAVEMNMSEDVLYGILWFLSTKI